MVYLDAYNPRARHLKGLGAFVHHPRHRYLTGMGAHYPRHRYLTGCGAGCGSGLMNQPGNVNGCGCCCGTSVTRLLGPLGDDIAPPSISAGAPPSAPSLFSTDPAFGPSGPAPPIGATYGPPLPPGFSPPPLAPQLPASALAQPVAPAINYASMPALTSTYASALVPQTYAPAALPGTFLGIPTQYFVYGGLGLLGLTVLGSMKKGGRRR